MRQNGIGCENSSGILWLNCQTFNDRIVHCCNIVKFDVFVSFQLFRIFNRNVFVFVVVRVEEAAPFQIRNLWKRSRKFAELRKVDFFQNLPIGHHFHTGLPIIPRETLLPWLPVIFTQRIPLLFALWLQPRPVFRRPKLNRGGWFLFLSLAFRLFSSSAPSFGLTPSVFGGRIFPFGRRRFARVHKRELSVVFFVVLVLKLLVNGRFFPSFAPELSVLVKYRGSEVGRTA
mmetsp:Transcript_5229/g.7385  ORF Transcript_5229/g.7385 Transcript_5229/m.7385 type:complete len:230 (-) Transcript_5229:146-835(-)